MANIFDVPSAWRNQLMPASFNDARFHCGVDMDRLTSTDANF
ncbi:hypothetical protein [Bradyrhizobium sp. BRP22]|nr:hypothetical protein [Bradyrhizobium sp. BRP22]